MHPLIPYGLGALAGAVIYAIGQDRLAERYQKNAFAVGVAAAAAGGAALWVLRWPAVPVVGLKTLAAVGAGLSAALAGSNFGMVAQFGSGGFSEVRTRAILGVALFMPALLLCGASLRPA